MKENKIQEFANSCGYDFAEKTDLIWNGYEVYRLRDNDREKGVTYYRGYPYFLLIRNNEIKKTTPKQSLEILRMFS